MTHLDLESKKGHQKLGQRFAIVQVFALLCALFVEILSFTETL